MMQRYLTILLITFIVISCGSLAYSQDQQLDTLPVQSKWSEFWTEDSNKPFKNVIKTNLSNPMIFGENYNVVGYERVITNNQTVNIYAGRFSMPRFSSFDGDELDLNFGSKDRGFTFAIDYRFYLKNENKYPAPHGIYIGPYYSYIHFQRENNWSLNTTEITGDLTTNIDLRLNLVGAQLGYQFVIKDRFTLDLIVLGPGIWFYNLQTKLSTTLSAADESLVFEKLNEILAEKLPGSDFLLKPIDLKKTGSVKSSIPGFRYMISLGFRF